MSSSVGVFDGFDIVWRTDPAFRSRSIPGFTLPPSSMAVYRQIYFEPTITYGELAINEVQEIISGR